MIRYSENPNLPLKIVETFNGKKEYRTNCKKIKNLYYVKGEDCFEVEGRWLRKDSGLIIFDYEKQEWILSAKIQKFPHMYYFGIVGFEPDGNVIKGYFSKNVYNNVMASSNNFGSLMALNTDLLAENGYIEQISTGKWYLKKELSSGIINKFSEITNTLKHNNKGYNIEDNAGEYNEKIQNYNNFPTALSKDVRRYARFLNDVTFGLEIECSHGYIPDHIQHRTGVVVCRDGSLMDEKGQYGPEFTTIPLTGAKGLQTIVNLSNELKKRTLLSEKCSFHIHLGNLPTSRLFLVSLYVLAYKIQDEIFSLFPYYKTDFNKANKEKDYCKKLMPKAFGKLPANPSKEEYLAYVEENYTKIFYWLSQNQDGSGYNPSKDWNRKKESHPVAQKWNRKNRYYWLNLINTLFSSRNTVEFRIHTPTVNSQKMINWLFICNAMVRYAILHPREILTTGKKISLNEILDYYKTTFRIPQAEILSEYLKAYCKERKDRFAADYAKGDFLSQWEIAGDKDYEFKWNNLTHLF